jgi:hypothetical protein
MPLERTGSYAVPARLLNLTKRAPGRGTTASWTDRHLQLILAGDNGMQVHSQLSPV